MAKPFVLTCFHGPSAQAIGSVGHEDQNEEAAKGDVGFPLFDNTVEKHDVEPDVGKDGPDGRDGEDASVLNFLHAEGGAQSFASLFRSGVCFWTDGVD